MEEDFWREGFADGFNTNIRTEADWDKIKSGKHSIEDEARLMTETQKEWLKGIPIYKEARQKSEDNYEQMHLFLLSYIQGFYVGILRNLTEALSKEDGV